jgi:hypothetical protein
MTSATTTGTVAVSEILALFISSVFSLPKGYTGFGVYPILSASLIYSSQK